MVITTIGIANSGFGDPAPEVSYVSFSKSAGFQGSPYTRVGNLQVMAKDVIESYSWKGL